MEACEARIHPSGATKRAVHHVCTYTLPASVMGGVSFIRGTPFQMHSGPPRNSQAAR